MRTEELKIGRRYIFRVVAGTQIITYTGELLEITDSIIRIKDKFGKEITINRTSWMSAEMENG